MRLLFRFYDIQGGAILIDGQDISQVHNQANIINLVHVIFEILVCALLERKSNTLILFTCPGNTGLPPETDRGGPAGHCAV